jgi:hypothetical protein
VLFTEQEPITASLFGGRTTAAAWHEKPTLVPGELEVQVAEVPPSPPAPWPTPRDRVAVATQDCFADRSCARSRDMLILHGLMAKPHLPLGGRRQT